MSSWIDHSIVNSILTGCLLMVIGFWAYVIYVRMWQRSLLNNNEVAIKYCEQLSMRLLPVSLLPRLIIEGQFENRNIRFYWKGGLMLECATIEYEQQTYHLEALKYQEDIESALKGLTIIDAHLEPTSKPQNQ